MEKMNGLDWTAIVLVIIGAINWGLYSLSTKFDLVSLVFQGYNVVSRIVYALVGLSGIYLIFSLSMKNK